jgi:glyoxylase-like metal-dependent hydrolase (beta-lactamase superfamily II)
MLNRRHFMGAGLAFTAYTAGSWVPVWAQNAPNLGTPALPTTGFKRMKVGDAEVVALNDGITRRPLVEEFVKNAPLAEVRAVLASQGLSTEFIDVPYTPFLVLTGGRKILIDTGLGEFGGATTGKLLENMRAAGVQPDEIDTVLISHFHGDHINGLRNKAGNYTFAKAKVMVPEAEFAFWMDDARMAAAPTGMKGAFDNVRRTFKEMPASMLVKFAAGDTVAPGIKSIAAYGHTPGHTLFELTSAGQAFHYVADLTNIPALFARNPDFAVTFDMDAEAARKVRREVLERITTSKALVGGFHFPFPAFGRMSPAGKGYAFEPVA